MSDIVERLRHYSKVDGHLSWRGLCEADAVDLIERQAREIAELRNYSAKLKGCLKPFADIDLTKDDLGTDFAWDVLRARAALEKSNVE